MLEDYSLGPTAAQRLRSGILQSHLDEFCSLMVGLGYKAPTIHHKLWVLAEMARWMEKGHLGIADLDERRVDEFVKARRRRGRTCRGFRPTALLLLQQLRSSGTIPTPPVVRDPSAAAVLLTRYDAYLRQERGLVDSTVSAYETFAREFVGSLDGGSVCPSALGAGDVRGFLVARAGRMAPRRAQYMGTALRSFLRFLFLRGETDLDLSSAVPTVRQWRLSTVPRYLSPPDVERLLRANRGSSTTGKRDQAILLLLARLGLRASEVASLKLDDLDWRAGEIIVKGKGLVSDRLPLIPEVGEALTLYLRQERPACACRTVFVCRHAPYRGFSHPSSVSTIVARALVRAGLTPAMRGAHLLRHSLATAMVRRGASLAEIGEVLRHRSPNTTEIYAKVDFDSLRDVAMAWPVARGAR
jgi:site-specific recombinase XerD